MAGLMLDRLEAVSQVALRIPASEATAEPVIIPHVGIKGVKAVQNKLMSAVGKPVSKESGLIMECSVPHSFRQVLLPWPAIWLCGEMFHLCIACRTEWLHWLRKRTLQRLGPGLCVPKFQMARCWVTQVPV